MLVAALVAPPARADTTVVGSTTLPITFGATTVDASPQNAPVFQGDASGNYVLSSPVSGTITSWSFNSGGAASGKTFALRVLRPVGSDWLGVATSAPVAVSGTVGVDSHQGPNSTSLPIQAGDRIALEPVNDVDTPIEDGVSGQDGIRYFTAAFPDGTSASLAPGATSDDGQVVPVQATVQFTPGGGGGGPGGGSGTPPTALLSAPHASAKAGSPLVFDPTATNLHGLAASSYTYTFPNGATAVCDAARPVLSPVFSGPVSGNATVTVRTATGGTGTASVPFSVKSHGAKISSAVKARLISSTCSSSQATVPSAVLKNSHNCVVSGPPDRVQAGFVEMQGGCIAEPVRLDSLPGADADLLPLITNIRHRLGLPPLHLTKIVNNPYPANDAFYASRLPVHINGLTVTPASGHAVILAVGAVGGFSGFIHKGLVYVVSDDATISVGPGAGVPLDSGRIEWNVSERDANGVPRGEKGVPILGVTLSNTAHAIPGIGWLAGLVVDQIPGADQKLTTLSFNIHRDSAGVPTYVTDMPFEFTNLPFGISSNSSTSVTVGAVLSADNDRGLNIDSFDVSAPKGFIGPLTVDDIKLHYARDADPAHGYAANTMTGSADAEVLDGRLGAKIVLGTGGLHSFTIDYQGSLPIFPPDVPIIYLTGATGSLDLDTEQLQLDSHFSIGGNVNNGCGLIGDHGNTTVSFDPLNINVFGNAEFFCIPAGRQSFLAIDHRGYATFGSQDDLVIPPGGGPGTPGPKIELKGNFSGQAFFAPSDDHYAIQVEGGQSMDFLGISSGGSAVISDKGMAACADISGPFGFHWTPGLGARYTLNDITKLSFDPAELAKFIADRLDFDGDGCDLAPYETLGAGGPPTSSRVHSAANSFTVPKGEKVAAVLFHGSGAPPAVILHGPNGRVIDASGTSPVVNGTELVLHLTGANETEVEIAGNNAGTWTIDAAPGSAPISSVATSHQIPAPKVTGHVTGHGAFRFLHYSLSNIPRGTKVSFVEQGKGGGEFLGHPRGSHGKLRFTPSDARRGRRMIIAQFTALDGLPKPPVTVTRYTASPPRPGRPSHLRVRRGRGRVVVTFRPAARSEHQLVSVLLSNHAARPYVLGPHAKKLVIHVPRRVRVVALAVRGVEGGLEGPAARFGKRRV